MHTSEGESSNGRSCYVNTGVHDAGFLSLSPNFPSFPNPTAITYSCSYCLILFCGTFSGLHIPGWIKKSILHDCFQATTELIHWKEYVCFLIDQLINENSNCCSFCSILLICIQIWSFFYSNFLGFKVSDATILLLDMARIRWSINKFLGGKIGSIPAWSLFLRKSKFNLKKGYLF